MNNNEKVFLCHNSRDKPMVRRLSALLNKNKLGAWVDECELKGGAKWQGELGQALINARAVIVCLGPHNIGQWQWDEIEVLLINRKKTGNSLIPVILPSCGDTDPDIPLFLQPFQMIDLRDTRSNIDPFGKLLSAVDSRDSKGHYRPSVLIFGKPTDSRSIDAHKRVISYCQNSLHRIQEIDAKMPLVKTALKAALSESNTLLLLLDVDSFNPCPSETFRHGLAEGAKLMAQDAGVEVIAWRSDTLSLPEDSIIGGKFRSINIETCLPVQLGQHVAQCAEEHFEDQSVPISTNVTKRIKTVLGFPERGRAFARKIASLLQKNEIRCDSAGNWQRVSRRLRKTQPAYNALIVILNGEPDWYDSCSEAIDDLEYRFNEFLPDIGAYVHQSGDENNLDPIPIDLDQFNEYIGESGLKDLVERIKQDTK